MRERPGLTPDGLYWLSKRKGSDNWQRTWFDAGSRQTRCSSLSTSDLRAALEKLALWWAENRRLSNERPESVALSEVLVRYYREYAKDLPSGTQARIACAKLTAHSGAVAVSAFDHAQQQAFIASMREEGNSAGYIRRTLSVAKAALAWAWTRNLIRIVPNVKLPEDGEAKERLLSNDELRAILEQSTEEHLYRFVVIELATWARPDAILDLTRERCDLERRLITLNPEGRKQTKKHRPALPSVPAMDHVVLRQASGYLIQWRGHKLGSIKTTWRKMRTRAGLSKDVVPYSIRHTMATNARAAGCHPWEIEGWLGHKRPSTSERYAKYAPDYLGSVATFTEAFMRSLPLRA